MKIYVLMCLNDIVSDTCYTSKEKVEKLVNEANRETGSRDFWYEELILEKIS